MRQWWTRLTQRWHAWRLQRKLWHATKTLRGTGMVIVNAEDWADLLATAETLQQYVHTSGHINNGRHKSRDKLRYLSNRVVRNTSRFVDPAGKLQPKVRT